MSPTKKAPGQEFEELLLEARKDPEAANYLDSFSVTVGNWILTERLSRGMTQKQLADLAGTTQSRISQVEAGFEGIKMNTINKIVGALKLHVPDAIKSELEREEAVATAVEAIPSRVKMTRMKLVGATH
ncbi:helix-turn-helix domain-containing protein [Paenibacillus sp. TAB 01]|uniref:helix-turn-helix domain-containing protein n=1 Tax=Paenibacillus sp. TAB 01 TaxID=3368988 RepID=UPI003752F483